MSRRGALWSGLKGALAIGALPTVAMAAPATKATPSMTEGPYWEDEKLLRKDVRTDTSTKVAQSGFPLYLTVTVSKLASGKSTPLQGAYVDIWHANASGAYSDEPAGMGQSSTLGQNWLRGYQVTDAHGVVRFVTIYPGWYSGRTPHIHARVRIYSGSSTTTNFTTQFFFNETITADIYKKTPYSTKGSTQDTTNAEDNIYSAVTTASGATSSHPDGEITTLRMNETNTAVLGSYNIVLI